MGGIEVPVLGPMYGWQLTLFIVGVPGVLVALWMRGPVREPARTGLGSEAAVAARRTRHLAPPRLTPAPPGTGSD